MAVYQADIYVEFRDDSGDRFWYSLFDETFRSAFSWEEAEAKVRESLDEKLSQVQYESLKQWIDEHPPKISLELWGVWQRSG